MNSAIIVLSTNRAEKAVKTAIRYVGTDPVYIITRSDCAENYANAISRNSCTNSVLLHILPAGYSKGIAQARDYAIKFAEAKGYEVILCSDDDVSLATLDETGHAYSLGTAPGAYNCIAKLLMASAFSGRYGITGVRDRLFCNKSFVCQLPIRVVAINIGLFKKLGLSYTFCEPFTVMEDYYVALKMLSLGVAWHIHRGFVCGDGGTAAAGGCSEFRTPEIQSRCARSLSAQFPDWVTPYQKHGAFGDYIDVKFQRKKIAEALAFASVSKNNK
jgi:hypothetical protein